MTRLVTILAILATIASVYGFPGEKIKRDFNSDFAVGQGDPELDEQNASVSNENRTDCSGTMGMNEDNDSREMAYNRDTPLESYHGGHSFSSATSSASASSNSYNLKNQNNIGPK